jgi:hypothetical protein
MQKENLVERIFPVFYVTYPLLGLFSTNLNYVAFSDFYRSFLIALLGLLVLWSLFRLLVKGWSKAGALVSLTAVLFFSYGHIYLLGVNRFGEGFRHRYLLLAYALVGLILTVMIVRKWKTHSPIHRFLSVVGVVLVGLSVFQIGLYQSQIWRSSDQGTQQTAGVQADTGTPDVYLIILDAHTRSDVLLEDYRLDNSAFISELEQLGFYVADCSQSNYPLTDLSLQSLFNMAYIDQFIHEGDVLPGLKDSSVKQTFDDLGYTTIAFRNYFSSHYDLDEDIHLQRISSSSEKVSVFTGLNEFETLVVETSALRLAIDFQPLFAKYFGGLFDNEEQYYSHYLETLFILQELKNLPETGQPRFVFAHIAVPHWPFVFSEAGEYEHIWGLDEAVGYRKNVIFIDSQIPGVVEEIISHSKTPPVIIIMGDHGPTGEGVPIESRMSNLYAVYADQEVLGQLSPWSTPVNIFRLVFNQYFGTDYPLLENISYDIWNNEDYDLTRVVPNTCTPE